MGLPEGSRKNIVACSPGVPTKRRVAYTSASLAAINAVVSTGLAVTAQLESLLTADLRVVGEAENLPLLPSASIVLMRKPNSVSSPIIECFAEYIVDGFKL